MPVTIVGNNTPTAGGVVYGDGTNYVSTSAGTAGQVLLSNGSSAPSFGAVPTVNLATGVTGTLPVANGGTGAASLTANNVLLGNGTSAVQVVAPGTNGNVLMSNGTTWTSAAVSSGALTLLQTVTASSSSTVDLQTGIGSTYDFYLITFTNITVSSNGLLNARLRIGGAYDSGPVYHAMANAGYSNGTGNVAINTSSGSEFQLTVTSVNTSAGSTCSGQFWFSNPTSTSAQQKIVNWVVGGVNASSSQAFTTQGTGAHVDPTRRALSGVRFFVSGASINTGVFRLYGFANS